MTTTGDWKESSLVIILIQMGRLLRFEPQASHVETFSALGFY